MIIQPSSGAENRTGDPARDKFNVGHSQDVSKPKQALQKIASSILEKDQEE